MRVHLQVLPASLHQAVQPDDPRAHPQGRRDLHVRNVRQDVQTPGQPQTAQMRLAMMRFARLGDMPHPYQCPSTAPHATACQPDTSRRTSPDTVASPSPHHSNPQ